MKESELVLLPGSYIETKDTKNRKTLEQRMRRVMRKAGYPVPECEDADCEQPDLCDTLALAGCNLGGGVTHPAATLTNIAAPFTWNVVTQVGNIPQSGSLTSNGGGSYTFNPGNGQPTTTFNVNSGVVLDPDGGNLLSVNVNGLTLTCADLAQCGLLDYTSAENGLNVVSTPAPKIRLGGPLIVDTNIDGGSAFDLTLTNLDGFVTSVNNPAGSAQSLFQMTKSVSLPITLTHTVTATPSSFGRLTVDADGNQTGLSQVTAAASAGVFATSATHAELSAVQGPVNSRAMVEPTFFLARSVDAGTISSSVYTDVNGAFIRNFNTANSANAQWLAEPDSAWGFVENTTTVPDAFSEVRLDAQYARLGYSPDKNVASDGSVFEVRQITGSTTDWATLITGLPTYVDNAAAVADLRPVDSLYKITDGARTLLAIVV